MTHPTELETLVKRADAALLEYLELTEPKGANAITAVITQKVARYISIIRDLRTALLRNLPAAEGEVVAWRMFDPARMPLPDENGWQTHPDFPRIENGDDLVAWLELRGWQVHSETGDVEEIIDYGVLGHDNQHWNPVKPDGDGWMLVSMHDTEDGPAAWFVRPTPAPMNEEVLARVVSSMQKRLRDYPGRDIESDNMQAWADQLQSLLTTHQHATLDELATVGQEMETVQPGSTNTRP